MELGFDAPPWLSSGRPSIIVHTSGAEEGALMNLLDCNAAQETGPSTPRRGSARDALKWDRQAQKKIIIGGFLACLGR